MSRNKSVNRLFLAVVVIYIAVSFGFSLLSLKIPFLADLPVYCSLLLSQALVFVPCFLYCKAKHIKIREFIPYRKISFVTIILVVICTYLMYPLIVVLNAVSMLFSNAGTASVSELMQGQSFILNTLFMALLPACVEEFMFRGVIFQTYKKSKMLPAILLSGFLFGCMHMNLNQFIYAFALGVYLAFLVEATGSIFSSMLAHFTLNFTSVLMAFFLPQIYEMLGISQSEAMQQVQPGGYAATMEGAQLAGFLIGILFWAVIALGATCAAVGMYIAICKINGRWGYVKRMFKGGTRERLCSIPLLLGIIIVFAFMGISVYLEWIAV
ncbi:MAG: CPBP family intramembrane metalloprotease [Lachnospiraceae bacterium]|nr:CPBP family intramembrane metalloprotease [Lachnospiraceae bacterium]